MIVIIIIIIMWSSGAAAALRPAAPGLRLRMVHHGMLYDIIGRYVTSR